MTKGTSALPTYGGIPNGNGNSYDRVQREIDNQNLETDLSQYASLLAKSD